MPTARTATHLIDGALALNAIFPRGGTPDANFRTDALTALQDLLAELEIPWSTWEAITLVVGQESYTVGENGSPDLDTVRPNQITGAFVRNASNRDYPVGIIDEGQYKLEVDKGTANSRPKQLWYNPTSPNGTVYTIPAPAAIESLYICSDKPMAEPATIDTDILNTTLIPRAIYNDLKWILAEEIAPRYGKVPSRKVEKRADEGRDNILRIDAIRKAGVTQLDLAAISSSRRYSTVGDWWT